MDSSYFEKKHRDDSLGLPRYKGVTLSGFPPLKKDAEERMRIIENFDTRLDDVLLCWYAKSGTHWMFEILNMLLSGKLELVEESEESKIIEIIPDVNIYDAMPSPRLVPTHLPYRFLPKGYREKGHGKIVYIVRNPKDCAVSCYHHLSRSKMTGFLAPNWDTMLKNFMTEDFVCGGWFNYARDWREVATDNPRILHLFYDQFKKDPEANVRRIAEFLGLKTDDKMITEIVRKCDFDYMKTHKADDSYLYSTDGKPLIYREGIVGDWKNQFTVAQSEMFDKTLKETLKDSPLLKELEFD